VITKCIDSFHRCSAVNPLLPASHNFVELMQLRVVFILLIPCMLFTKEGRILLKL